MTDGELALLITLGVYLGGEFVCAVWLGANAVRLKIDPWPILPVLALLAVWPLWGWAVPLDWAVNAGKALWRWREQEREWRKGWRCAYCHRGSRSGDVPARRP
jgi:hypothetical protein